MSGYDHWYYGDARNQQHGPVSFQQLQQMIRNGQITATTMIWNESMTNWTPAGQVPGVFNSPAPASHPAPASFAPSNIPAAGAAISNNPFGAPAPSQYGAAAPGGSYPLPYVKRCSFGMLVTFFVVGFILNLIGSLIVVWGFFTAVSSQGSYYSNDARIIGLGVMYTVGQFLLVAGFACMIVTTVLSMMYLYRGWLILQPGRPRSTPGQAVGFLFIPFFNLYWGFVGYAGWSPDWNRIRSSYSNLAQLPPTPDGLFLAVPICFICAIVFWLVPIFGPMVLLAFYIVHLIAMHKVCSVVNAVADSQYRR